MSSQVNKRGKPVDSPRYYQIFVLPILDLSFL